MFWHLVQNDGCKQKAKKFDRCANQHSRNQEPPIPRDYLIHIVSRFSGNVGRWRRGWLPCWCALGIHARDELGISEVTTARPVQAAFASAATFSVGAAAPLALVLLSPINQLLAVVCAGSLAFLALLGAIGALAGGADAVKPTIRVTFWGALAMAVTAVIGAMAGRVV